MGILIDRIARQSEQRAHQEWRARLRELESRDRRHGYRRGYIDEGGAWFDPTRRERLMFCAFLLSGAAIWLGFALGIMCWLWR